MYEHQVRREAGWATGCEDIYLSLKLGNLINHLLWFSSKRQQKGLIICCDEVIKERDYREGWVRVKWGRIVYSLKGIAEWKLLACWPTVWAKIHYYRIARAKEREAPHIEIPRSGLPILGVETEAQLSSKNINYWLWSSLVANLLLK